MLIYVILNRNRIKEMNKRNRIKEQQFSLIRMCINMYVFILYLFIPPIHKTLHSFFLDVYAYDRQIISIMLSLSSIFLFFLPNFFLIKRKHFNTIYSPCNFLFNFPSLLYVTIVVKWELNSAYR